MTRLVTWKFAAAFGITLAILNAACAVALAIAPAMTIAFFNMWIHGVDFARLMPAGATPFSVPQIMLGMAAVGLVGFAVGGVLAFFYNALQGRP